MPSSTVLRRGGLIAAVLAVAIAVRGLSGCGASTLAARVDGTTISSDRVDAIVGHAQTEAKREGKIFPAKGTPAYDALRRQALDLLVYHEELAQGAAALGITVTSADYAKPAGTRRLELPGSEPGGDLYSVFVLESRREAILYQKVYRRVTRNVTVKPAEISAYIREHPRSAVTRKQIRQNLLDTKRNALMAGWIVELRRSFERKVAYGPAFRSG